jgi:hypothetical protein
VTDLPIEIAVGASSACLTEGMTGMACAEAHRLGVHLGDYIGPLDRDGLVIHRWAVKSADPLGLTPEQREEGRRRLSEDVVGRARKTMGDIMEQITERARRNREMIEALPPGTIVRITGDGHTWPDRTREQLLEEML